MELISRLKFVFSGDAIVFVEFWLRLLLSIAILRTRWDTHLLKIGDSASAGQVSTEQLGRWLRIGAAVRARHVKSVTCLEYSIALRIFLASRGVRTILRFGVVSSSSQGFAAHAWLEPEAEVFKTLFRDLPAREVIPFTPVGAATPTPPQRRI